MSQPRRGASPFRRRARRLRASDQCGGRLAGGNRGRPPRLRVVRGAPPAGRPGRASRAPAAGLRPLRRSRGHVRHSAQCGLPGAGPHRGRLLRPGSRGADAGPHLRLGPGGGPWAGARGRLPPAALSRGSAARRRRPHQAPRTGYQRGPGGRRGDAAVGWRKEHARVACSSGARHRADLGGQPAPRPPRQAASVPAAHRSQRNRRRAAAAGQHSHDRADGVPSQGGSGP